MWVLCIDILWRSGIGVGVKGGGLVVQVVFTGLYFDKEWPSVSDHWASKKWLLDIDSRNLPTYNACHITKRWFGMSTVFGVHLMFYFDEKCTSALVLIAAFCGKAIVQIPNVGSSPGSLTLEDQILHSPPFLISYSPCPIPLPREKQSISSVTVAVWLCMTRAKHLTILPLILLSSLVVVNFVVVPVLFSHTSFE